ncbi:MAG: MFS transporter [Thermoflavifilum sp.]|nr:MFS transporter [Thermoflavifilum sp.]
MAVSIAVERSAERMSGEGRKALYAAFFGFFVDMIDVYLPVVALGPAMEYFEPKGLSSTTSATLYYVIFALSLVGRPLGSIIFGHLGDKIGRRKTTLISVAGFGISTLLIALLPGYHFWGLTGIVLLAILRLVDGIFLGGEYTGANPLAMEYCPREQRGKYGALINTGFPAGLVIVSIITSITLQIFPVSGGDASYLRWGWRVPFLIGAALSGILFFYYYHQVPESRVWQESEKTTAPLRELFSGSNLRTLAQVFIMMSGAWFTINAVTSALPGVLKLLGVRDSLSTNVQLLANIVLVLLFVPVGVLGQRIGRRTVLLLIGVAGFTVAPFLYYVLVRSGAHNAAAVTILSVLINVLVTPVWAVVTAYITERFNTGVRASGYGIGYSLAAVIPSFSSFYMLALKNWMPYEYTQIVILMIGGVLISIGAWLGPERKDVSFDGLTSEWQKV